MGFQGQKIDLPLIRSGKVRDVYSFRKDYLIVASDRISAFDYVIPTLIPNKGKILHKLSMFWFDFVKDIVPNHIISGNFDDFPVELKKYDCLRDRSMLVKKAERINIECVVRGYLAGSGWKEYQKSETVCAVRLPRGLRESSKIPEPIFTPSSKEENGKHDENISFEEMVKRVGKNTAENLSNFSIELYKKVSDYVFDRGIILADTKLEFGFCGDKIILIDEVFTPDSSRFWEVSKYEDGKPQNSLDKQYVRDYLEQIGWDKLPPVPELPNEIVEEILKKYDNIYEKLTDERIL
ncbi:MAG: phosphoribosylaminoimidazolesuccinocarboxamide synthase [Elusimicrobiota bacterium]|jgi:phosphoribosylaminoimidazole-succinocarboxamide synthase|nr:phosphoribosylaminoimidazolesuccinocarboxamide synthase [Elusimicrobiota bacterium]